MRRWLRWLLDALVSVYGAGLLLAPASVRRRPVERPAPRTSAQRPAGQCQLQHVRPSTQHAKLGPEIGRRRRAARVLRAELAYACSMAASRLRDIELGCGEPTASELGALVIALHDFEWGAS